MKDQEKEDEVMVARYITANAPISFLAVCKAFLRDPAMTDRRIRRTIWRLIDSRKIEADDSFVLSGKK